MSCVPSSVGSGKVRPRISIVHTLATRIPRAIEEGTTLTGFDDVNVADVPSNVVSTPRRGRVSHRPFTVKERMRLLCFHDSLIDDTVATEDLEQDSKVELTRRA